jgi:hypothetical protein
MSAPTAPLIVEFLSARPLGATGNEIAAYLETTPKSACQTLARMLARGEVCRSGAGPLAESMWSLPAKDGVSEAMLTLEGMRAVAHRVFAEYVR